MWGPTINRMQHHRTCIAPDQRGHGRSPKPAKGYAVADYVRDLRGLMQALGMERPHLAGHSMGARIAMVAAAQYPEEFRSVAIVDMGPEAWAENWRSSVAAFDRLPESWPDAEAAIGNSARTRNAESVDAALAGPNAEELRGVALARLDTGADGRVRWLASMDALKQTVVVQRSRNYWRDWERIRIPALLVKGETSREVRPAVAEAMRRRNASIRYEEIPATGHNVPLLAPGRLATVLEGFWAEVDASAG